jgi:hypothetical protein
MKKNTKCPYRKNVLCSYLEFPENNVSNVCSTCPHYVSAQRGMSDTLPEEGNGRIFLILLPIAVLAALGFLIHILILYFRP